MYVNDDLIQTEIGSLAYRVLGEVYPLSRYREQRGTHSDSLARARLAELGFFQMGVAEDHGGAGQAIGDQVSFAYAIGKHCAPIDLLATMLASEIAATKGDVRLSQTLGKGSRVGVVFPSANALGICPFEPGSEVLAFAPADPTGFVFLGPTEELVTAHPGIALEWQQSLISGIQVAVGRVENSRAAAYSSGQAFDRGVLLLAAVLTGVADAALEMAVSHAGRRIQFGAPIGANQAIRHPCADIATQIAVARAQVQYAALMMESDGLQSSRLASFSKVLAGNAAKASCRNNIQVHGGIGMTDEFSAHVLLKYMHVAERWFGAETFHLARIENC